MFREGEVTVHIRQLICAAGMAAIAFGAAPAAAAPVAATTDAFGKALILVPLTLTKVQDLDFGTVVTSSTAGTVTIDPATGARTSAGGVTEVTSDPGQRAVFAGAGSASQQVDINLPSPSISLSDGNGNTIPGTLALEFTTTTIDPVTRAFYVGVGGTLDIAADQPDGDYNALFDITANYQ